MIPNVFDPPAVFYKPFQYHESKIKIGKAELLEKNFIGGSVSTFKDTIKLSDRVRNLNSNLVHVSLSPSNNDELTKEELLIIGKEYLKKMGISENRPILIYYHTDTTETHKKPHIHILTTKIDYNGEKINDSFMRVRSMFVARELEKQFSLEEVKITKGEKKSLSEINAKKHNKDFKLRKDKVKKAVKQFGTLSKSLSEFEEKMRKNGFYIRKISSGKGLTYVYGIDGFYFKEKQLGKQFTLAHLQRKIEGKVTFTRNEQKIYLKRNVERVLKYSTSLQEFELMLQSRGIKLIKHENKSGIYGLSFSQIGIDNPVEFKASELDRKLSWSNIKSTLETNKANRTYEYGKTYSEHTNQQATINNVIPAYFSPPHLQKDNEEEMPWKKKKRKRKM